MAVPPTPNPPPTLREPLVAAATAYARGLMPLAPTRVPAFLAAHPTWDGRGVLIGIMDGGLDSGVPGFDSTTAGAAKVLDLRDFSSEGRIPLVPVTPLGDSVVIAGRRLAGFGRVRGIVATGPWYGGMLRERVLGDPPAADVNDNGMDADSLPIIVGRAPDGWVLFVDSDGDGSLARERPVHDYLVLHETFGWHRPGEPPPLSLAANFQDVGGLPALDLFYDTQGHGTHVAGIATGHNIGGIDGFNGVAPGAQLLGLKIARNDYGGLSTTGSMVAAMDYAIRFAASRGLPLVLNMSYGVGNEREGAARIDALLDSILAAHPDIVFVTSAGNDGPGLSTIGFPGSARRAITVGATQPAVLAGEPGGQSGDVLFYFSSRGGELAKPDVIGPGIAYSTVPRWNTGDEVKGGTSMASPHVAGLAALLLSAARQEGREVTAEDIRRALTASARRLIGTSPLDEGAGQPAIDEAWRILRAPAPGAVFDVESVDQPGATAAFHIAPAPADTSLRFRIIRVRGVGALDVTLTSDSPWLTAPGRLRLDARETPVTLTQHPPLSPPGVLVGTVRASAPGLDDPLFTLVTTVVIPESRRVAPVRVTARLAQGGVRRIFFPVDSGRPFRVRMSTAGEREHLIAALHQPNGQPIFGENGIPGGADSAAAIFDVDGSDARRGHYEADAVASSSSPLTARIAIDPAPISLRTMPGRRDTVQAVVTSLEDSVIAGRVRMGLLGGQRHLEVGGRGSADVAISIEIPPWTHRIVLDLELDPAQWPRFTDFGFTLLDAGGRILGKSPLNYAAGRLDAELPARSAALEATVVFSPGFAEARRLDQWAGRLTLRLEADRPVALASPDGDEFRLAPGGTATFRVLPASAPWPLPEGFTPLALFVGESGGIAWTWETPLIARGGASLPR